MGSTPSYSMTRRWRGSPAPQPIGQRTSPFALPDHRSDDVNLPWPAVIESASANRAPVIITRRPGSIHRERPDTKRGKCGRSLVEVTHGRRGSLPDASPLGR